jgi:hypothetical protein
VCGRRGEILSFSHYLNICGNLLSMSDNVIKSTDVTSGKEEKNTVKKAPAKKAAAPKAKAEKKAEEVKTESGKVVVIFESGASYVSGEVHFTRQNNIQEVSEAEAAFLLTLENFRLPDQLELEDYLNSKED